MLLLPQGNIGADPEWVNKLMTFVQSPQAQGIAGGLLANSGPSMTAPTSFGSALGQGLLKGAQFAQLDREQKERERHNKQQDEYNQLKTEIEKSKYENDMRQSRALEGLLGMSSSEVQAANPMLQAGGILQSTGRPIINNPDGSISTENSITVTDPRINGGKPTNIESIVNGQQVDDEAAIQAAMQSGKPYQSFNSIKEAVDAAKARSAQLGQSYQQQGGLLNQSMQNVPRGTNMPPPQFPEENINKAKAILASTGDRSKAIEALYAKPELTELEKVARAAGLIPGTKEYSDFLIRAKTKPAAEININENAEKVKAQKRAESDVKAIDVAKEKAKPGRDTVKRAKASMELAEKLRKKGIDPARYFVTKQVERERIKSALGDQASADTVAEIEQLNKNAIYLMSDMVKSLGGRPNQFIEQQFAKAVPGQDVSLRTIEKLSVELMQAGYEAQYEGRFLDEYDNKHGSLAGSEETFERWLDSNPFVRPANNKKGYEIVPEKEIEQSWKLWVDPEATYQRLLNKPENKATRAELEFMARYEE